VPDPVLGQVYRVSQAFIGEPPVTHQQYMSLFIQDTWQLDPRLTLRPGLRWERQRLVGGTPICHENDTAPGRADGTGAAVPCGFTWSGSWAPRLGLTYDLRGDGRSKLFASWGRFFARLPNGLAVRALSADAMVSRADYYDSALTQPVPDGVLAAGTTRHFSIAGQSVTPVDPGSKPSYLDEWAVGVELEPLRDLAVGARYVRRRMPRVLEDVGSLPAVAYDLKAPAVPASVEYAITNVGPHTPVTQPPGLPAAAFEEPRHLYDAVELFGQKSWADDWALVASYRWSRLRGNFEGFFRSDNRQSDPGISSLFDFPTNDPSYTQVGGAQFGYQGDIRYLGCTLGCGALPNDRTHQVKLYGSRAFGRLNMGAGILASSGKPLTALAAHPVYGNGGEIPLTVRGEGLQTTAGFRRRTAIEHTVDLHADYTFRFGERRLMLVADLFNAFNRQEATDYDNWTELSFGVPNPNFGQPTAGGGAASASYQPPRAVRLGARFEW
jgi:outer membrane receptor protein involved in Fe transport